MQSRCIRQTIPMMPIMLRCSIGRAVCEICMSNSGTKHLVSACSCSANLNRGNMAKKQKKLNSMRLLEANKIPYEVLEYDASIKDASLVAESVGIPEFMVYKTLIVYSVATEQPMIV